MKSGKNRSVFLTIVFSVFLITTASLMKTMTINGMMDSRKNLHDIEINRDDFFPRNITNSLHTIEEINFAFSFIQITADVEYKDTTDEKRIVIIDLSFIERIYGITVEDHNTSCIVNSNHISYENGTDITLSHQNFTHDMTFQMKNTIDVNTDFDVMIDYEYFFLRNETDFIYDYVNKIGCNVKRIDGMYTLEGYDDTVEYLDTIGSEILDSIPESETFKLNYRNARNLQNQDLTFSVAITIFTILSFILVFFMIYSVTKHDMLEKLHEFGIHRTMGKTKKEICWDLVKKSVRKSVCAMFIGIALSLIVVEWIFPSFLSSMLNDPLKPFVPTIDHFIPSILSVILASCMSSYIPSRKIYKYSIQDLIDTDKNIESKYIITKVRHPLKKYVGIIGILLLAFSLYSFTLFSNVVDLKNFESITNVVFLTLVLFILGSVLLINYIITPIFSYIVKKLPIAFDKKFALSSVLLSRINHIKPIIIVSIISVIFTTGLSSLINSVDIQTQNQFYVNRGSPIQLSSDENFVLNYDITSILEIEGVTSVSKLMDVNYYKENYWNEIDVSIHDVSNVYTSEDFNVIGIDENYYDSVFTECISMKENNFAESFEELKNGDIMISTTLSEYMNLHIGDSLEMTFQNGVSIQTRTLRICGVFNELPSVTHLDADYTLSGKKSRSIAISFDILCESFSMVNNNFGYHSLTLVNCEDGVDLEEVRNEIRKILPEYTISVHIYGSSEDMALVKIIITALFVILNIVVSINTIHSIQNTIEEKDQDIRILRTLGTSVKRIQELIKIEALVILSISIVLGVILGTMFGYLYHINLALFINIYGKFTIGFKYLLFSLFSILIVPFFYVKLKQKHLVKKYAHNTN